RARRGNGCARDARHRPPLVVAVVVRAARRGAVRGARAAAARALLRSPPVGLRDRERPVRRRAPRLPARRADPASRAPASDLPELVWRDVRGPEVRRRGGAFGDERAFVATARRNGPAMDRLSGEGLEEALAALLYDDHARKRLRAGEAADPRFAAIDMGELEEAARAVRRMVRGRTHRGTGGLEAWFPRTLAPWRHAHPPDIEPDDLLTRVCSSSSSRAWSELGDGISLEEAFYRFFLDEGIGSARVLEEELFSAVVRALAIAPAARFEWPAGVRRAPGGCYAVTRGRVLY